MASWGEYYHAIASQMALYRASNRRLVELAELKPGMSVLDLACGSGLTSQAALEAVPEGLTLYLLDASASMIETARAQIGDRAAGYLVADASQAADLLPGKMDRILCNLSLWYFKDPEAVLRSLRPLLKPTGRLCFTLLGSFFNAGGGVVSPQWALMHALHKAGRIGRAIPDVEFLPNQRSIEGTLHGTGFKPIHFDLLEIPTQAPETEPGGELYNLLRLHPVTDAPSFAEAVARSHAWLREQAEAIAAWQPSWRTVTFMAQPAISPEEILMAKFGKQMQADKGE